MISMTTITVERWRDMPSLYVAGLRFRRTWPTVGGAVGVLYWARPWDRSSGAVAAWRTPDDFRRFIDLPVHLELMRRYGGRGEVTIESWSADRFSGSEVRWEASQKVRWPV